MEPNTILEELEEVTFNEIEEAAGQKNPEWDDVEETVEDLLIKSRQLSISADAFGKKVWKKFTDPLWEACQELDEAVEESQGDEVRALIEEAKGNLDMLKKVVK